MKRNQIMLICIVMLFILVSGCNLPLIGGTSEAVVITQPQDGAHLRSGTTIDVQASFSVSGNAIAASLLVNDQPFRRDAFNTPIPGGNIYQPWAPPGPGTYILQVLIEDSQDGVNQSKPITVYVDESKDDTPTPTEEITTPTTTSTLTPTITLTATSENTTATADINLNCRVGPGYDYETTDGLRQGETSLIVGVNDQRTWGLIEGPHDTRQCWVPLDYTTIVGDIASAPVYPAPPLSPKPIKEEPTKTPTETPYGPTKP
jgi:uncharacterized protein YraI